MDKSAATGTMDKLQEAILGEEMEKASKNKKKKYEFDKLKLYFGEDFVTPGGIVISQPSIGAILEIGEEEFYRSISPFLYNSTSIRVPLWDMGMDWNKVKDIEVFALLIQGVDKGPLKQVFKDLDFDDFRIFEEFAEGQEPERGKGRLAVYSKSQDVLIYEDEYMLIAEYVREMMNFHPKVEKAKGKTAKNWIIQEDKMNQVAQIRKGEGFQSALLPLVSACENHPGFKYNLKQLKEVGIYQFMDCVKRIQKYESATAALKGCYSGFVDVKKINKEALDFMGDI